MPIVSRKPRNASLRFQTFLDNSDITTNKPEKSLVKGLKKTGGRNAYGRITTRHHGGGAYQKYRIIDFKRDERDVSGKIVSIEYDPNRNVRIALVVMLMVLKKYILLPEDLAIGGTVISGKNVEPKVGNAYH